MINKVSEIFIMALHIMFAMPYGGTPQVVKKD